MKVIKDYDSLAQRMSRINSNWQRYIYDATGAILLESLYLVSNCGYISLDQDSEYSYSYGVDTSEYCEINSIEELISYIKEMDSYADCLVDISYGKFSKSELFWGIFERILLQPDNLDETGEQNWGLFSISRNKEHVALHMSLLPCAPCDIWLDITPETSLNDALEMLIAQLNVEVENCDWLPAQKVFDVEYAVPNTYDKLLEKCTKGSVFGYLS